MYYGQNPFMNPYGYNPYQSQPVQSMQQSYQQYQNQYQPMQTMQTAPAVPVAPVTIPGQMVDSLEAAKAKDIDMSGSPRYYPNINGSEIYMKQLQADGTCPTVVYRRVVEQPAVQPQADIMNVMQAISDMRQQIVQEVTESVVTALQGIPGAQDVQPKQQKKIVS